MKTAYHKNTGVEEAIKKLSDQTTLADIAKNADDNQIGIWALSKLSNPSLLADVAKNSRHFFVGAEAVNKITDLSVLEDIVEDGKEASVRHKACERIIHDYDGCVCKRCGHTKHEYIYIEDYKCEQRCSLCSHMIISHIFWGDTDANDTYYVPGKLARCERCRTPNPDFN